MWQDLFGCWLYVTGFVADPEGVTSTIYWRRKLWGSSDVTDPGIWKTKISH